MSWKRSKDGGIDYEVEELIAQHKREQQPKEFNPFATATTMTFGLNQEEVMFDNPKNAHERIHNFRLKKRREAEEKLMRGLV